MFALFVEGLDYSVGQFFPSLSLMATRSVCLYGKGGVEQEDTLVSPPLQVAGCGDGFA